MISFVAWENMLLLHVKFEAPDKHKYWGCEDKCMKSVAPRWCFFDVCFSTAVSDNQLLDNTGTRAFSDYLLS